MNEPLYPHYSDQWVKVPWFTGLLVKIFGKKLKLMQGAVTLYVFRGKYYMC